MIETVPSGTVLHGRYRIERVLGSGGFGHVYLAVDLTSGQQFAVKEYLVTGATGQEQLKHEAKVLRNLHHPSLPAFHDAFIERGRYYVVLNYIEGNDLTDLVRMARQRNEVIPLAQLLTWLLAICDAVMFLHSQQPIVIHRDIKPDNIRITPNGTAVLVDLGNAKAVADGARTLFFIRHQGTPGYAPPEQYPGGSGTDARSDIYALGGTLYFALTMHEPPSVSVRNQSLQQGLPTLPSLQEHLANNPPPETPEEQAARQFRLGVSKPGKPAPRHSRHIAQLGTLPPDLLNRLNTLIHRAMALKPRDRYAYVAEFANELKQVLRALPQPPTPSGTDPHSTQPDLPGIYDALMEAKEQQNRQRQQGPGGAQPTPPGPGNVSVACPHCGAQLMQRSTFCPRCGVPLGPTNTQQAASEGSGKKDVSAEQTLVIHPAKLKQAMASSSVRGPGAAPAPAHSPAAGQHSPAVMSPAQVGQSPQGQVQTMSPAVSQNGHVGGQGQGAQARDQGFKMTNSLWLMVLVILILIIVAVVLIVLIQQRQQASTFPLHLLTTSQQQLFPLVPPGIF